MFFIPISVVAVSYFLHGRSVAEKVATVLAMPLGVACWITLAFALRFASQRNSVAATVAFATSLLIYLAGNPMFSGWLMQTLESQYAPVTLDDLQPLDTVVVLGGGTNSAPNGRPQFAEAGDRLGLAIRLYHRKLCQKIIVTGDVLRGTEENSNLDPSHQSKAILIDAGVPETSIEELAGTNTLEEMKALKERATDRLEGKRWGLITSAFHMPRAMRLAKVNQLELIPIVADYRAPTRQTDLRQWLPTAGSAEGIELAFREYLGMLLGR
jgi:uncharacterized SAM-binding protein YcdF (DUF218 family)